MTCHQLEIKNQPQELARLAGWLNWLDMDLGLSHRCLFRLELAAEEAVTNVLEYAYPSGEDHSITIRLCQEGHSITLEIQDEGQAYNPLAVPEKVFATTLQEAEIGGLGIALIRNYTDSLHYRRENQKNILTLVFHDVPE